MEKFKVQRTNRRERNGIRVKELEFQSTELSDRKTTRPLTCELGQQFWTTSRGPWLHSSMNFVGTVSLNS